MSDTLFQLILEAYDYARTSPKPADNYAALALGLLIGNRGDKGFIKHVCDYRPLLLRLGLKKGE